jgi:hypothetical protein
MAKKAKLPKEKGALRAGLGPLGMMFGIIPGQVRLASREQQPRLAPKAKRGRGR